MISKHQIRYFCYRFIFYDGLGNVHRISESSQSVVKVEGALLLLLGELFHELRGNSQHSTHLPKVSSSLENRKMHLALHSIVFCIQYTLCKGFMKRFPKYQNIERRNLVNYLN